MPTITSAQSGPSNVGSTWVGGVVPASLFEGARTTTGVAVAAGATSIPVAAGAQAVTAGRWIRVAGDPNWYRVATGLAANAAGNIVIDAPGLLQAIPASATTVSVNMIEDKVIIAHPGTNRGDSTPYVTNGALSAGATSIPVTGGIGTIVVGECIQVRRQTGTDEDGQPIYDNTYYRVTTGITGAGTLVVTPGLSQSVPSGTTIVNCGHVITLEANHVWGDDTSSLTAANNGIVVSGTLRASRTNPHTLVARGTLFIATGGTLDYGCQGDTIPDGVTATLAINDSATLGIGKHAVASRNQVAVNWKIRGIRKTRNTRLADPTSAGANSIQVLEATGWRVGDRVAIASATDLRSGAQIVTLSGGSGTSWTVTPAITVARSANTRVGNLGGNVVLRPYSASFIASAAFETIGAPPIVHIDIGDLRFENIGANTSGWNGFNSAPAFQCFGLWLNNFPQPRTIRASGFETTSAAHVALISVDSPSLAEHGAVDCAMWAVNAAVYWGNVGASFYRNCVVYNSATVIRQTFGPLKSAVLEGGESWADSFTSLDSSYAGIVRNHTTRLSGRFVQQRLGTMRVEACAINSNGISQSLGSGASGGVFFSGCTFSAGAFSVNNIVGGVPDQLQVSTFAAVNGVASDNRVVGYFQDTRSDTSNRRRSTYSVRINPTIANTDTTYTFAIPATVGVAQSIRGSLRFDGNYGTANPPRIALAGQGVSQSFTAPPTADAWHDFQLDFTPTSTGDITATVTVRSANTTGFVWLDGIYHFPMIQSVRHFGRQWVPQASQPVDPRITLSESAALALPAVIDHVAQTITVSSPMTPREVFEACMADLCQPANLDRPVHITSATGDTFATTYTVVFTGSGVIPGPYTDAGGLRVAITAPALVDGSRVQLYNVTDQDEILNAVIGAGGLRHPIAYTGTDKVIRLRAEHSTKLPLEVAGVLTSSGLSYLDIQADDTVYAANGIDGAAVTEFVPDAPNIQVDLNDPDGVTSVRRLYAWFQHYQTTAAGIASPFFGAMLAIDEANYIIDQAKANILLDNVSGFPVRVVDGYLARRDGSTVIAPSSGSIQMDPGKAYVAAGGGGGGSSLTAADVWSHPTRTLTNGDPIVLSPGERLVTVQNGNYFART